MALMRRPSRLVRRLVVAAVVLGAAAGLGGTVACGTSPVGVDACKRIEQVRCESAQACGIDLDTPTHIGDSPEEKVAACIRYYDVACLHGLATSIEPATQAVDSCVNAIISGDCSVVKTPESNAACQFLIPPAPAAADASDAGEGG
jgi:hypothetical protein